VYLWEPAGGAPLVVRTMSIEQAGVGDFRHLLLRPVMIRVESTDGILFISAERGRFRKDETETLILEPESPQGVVRLSGSWGGVPFVGVSPRAAFRQGEHVLAMDAVELVHRGRAERFLDRPKPVGQPVDGALADLDRIPSVLFMQNQNALRTGPNRERTAPILVAALAALPQPLVLPPAPRGERR